MAKHTKKMNSAERDQLEIAKNDPAKKPLLHEGHGRPTTRRDFLSTGLLSFSGFMMAPSILSIISRPSFASAAMDGCEAAAAVRLPAFVNVNLAGGAALSGNVVMLGQGGDPLPSYSILGHGPGAPIIEREFQGVGFHGVRNGRLSSQFLAGVRATAAQTTRDKTSFLSIAVPLGDDTSNNQIDPTGLVTAAGLTGDLLPKLGTRGTTTGVNQMAAKITPPAPLVVRNIADLTGALSPASALTTTLTDVNQRKSLLRLVSNLSTTQAREVASSNSSSGTALAKLVQCATDKNIELSTNPNPGIDPLQDTNTGLSDLWQMRNNQDALGQSSGNRVVMGSMVYNALKGNSGAVGLELGGYDYHGNNRITVQDARDFNAGQLVGLILQSAAVMGQKVFVTVTSDGSVGAGGGAAAGADYTGDRGSGGASYVLAFDPAGRPAMKNDRNGAHQLGWFGNGQGAVDTSLTGSAELAGIATFANYLAFAKQSALLDKVLPRQYTVSELDYVLRFA
jgi:hypothetical protein